MRIRQVAALAAAFVSLLFAGCSTMRGTPERYQASAAIVESIELGADELGALPTTADTNERNRVLNKAVAVIDQRFHAFVRSLAADRADAATVVAGSTLGASTAGAFVDSVKAKTNFALFGAGLVGAFGIVDKNYFYEKTVPALVAGMRAARAAVLVRIREGQLKPIQLYDGTAALQDIEEYYAAGTLLSAIAEITSRAESDASLSLDHLRELTVPTQVEIDNRSKIRSAILGIKDAAAVEKANQALKSLGLPARSTPADARRALVEALRPRTKERIAVVEKALKDAQLLK